MKKTLALLIAIIMLVSLLVSCSRNDTAAGLPEGMSGTDAAKLLLANLRLSDNIINKEDSIFTDGAAALSSLADKTRKSLDSLKANETRASTSTFSDTKRSLVNMSEFSSSYVEFSEIANLIIALSEQCAEMINYVKKNVRVLDTWVRTFAYGSAEIYLHVEKNSETILIRYDTNSTVCHRYKNAKGQNVYEMYNTSSEMTEYSKYIAGEYYEHNVYFPKASDRYDSLVAQNIKGYWEVFTDIRAIGYPESPSEPYHIPKFFVMKDDICYTYLKHLNDGRSELTLTNTARTSDIISQENVTLNEYTGKYVSSFTIFPAAFNGASQAFYDPTGSHVNYLLLDSGEIVPALTMYKDGRKLSETDDLTDHDLFVRDVISSEFVFGCGTTVLLTTYGNSPEHCRELVKDLLSSWGLTCKYASLDSLFASIDRANAEAEDAIRYYKRNGYGINSEQELEGGLDAVKENMARMKEICDKAKDAPVYSMTEEIPSELTVPFSQITDSSVSSATFADGKASIGSITLSTTDVLLAIEGEKYAVFYALASDADGSLTHIDASNIAPTAHGGGDTLSASGGNSSFELHSLAEGEYTLVAYIATHDGIRVSETIPVTFDSIAEMSYTEGNMDVRFSKAADSSLKLTCVKQANAAYITLTAPMGISYDELYELVALNAYSFGTISDDIFEKMNADGSFSALASKNVTILSGAYRTTYTVVNGNTTTGFLYINLTVS